MCFQHHNAHTHSHAPHASVDGGDQSTSGGDADAEMTERDTSGLHKPSPAAAAGGAGSGGDATPGTPGARGAVEPGAAPDAPPQVQVETKRARGRYLEPSRVTLS